MASSLQDVRAVGPAPPDAAMDVEAQQEQRQQAVTKDTAASAPAAKPSRMYWMDWLRVLLTVLVLLHHCVHAYAEPNYYWTAQGNTHDIAAVLIGTLFLGANQAYFMGLFFVLAGYCTPGSFRRKGPWRWIVDRSIRLLLPVLLYSLIINPVIPLLNAMAAGSPLDASQHYAAYFKAFPVVSGPPWFVYMLWWFSVAYLGLGLLSRTALGKQCGQLLARGSAKACCRPNNEQKEQQQQQQEYSRAAALKLMAMCIAVLVLTMFVARCATLAAGLQPLSFYKTCHSLVNFMPDMLPQYFFCFSLGVAAVSSNALRRLPSSFGWWCLVCGGCWWLYLAMPVGFASSSWLFSTVHGALLSVFVTQSFAVVWSFGLLVVFRDTFNNKPGKLGSCVIGAAYAVYIIHPLFVTLFAWALKPVVFPTYAINIFAISPMVVISSWPQPSKLCQGPATCCNLWRRCSCCHRLLACSLPL